jgi:hypothetical protein
MVLLINETPSNILGTIPAIFVLGDAPKSAANREPTNGENSAVYKNNSISYPLIVDM